MLHFKNWKHQSFHTVSGQNYLYLYALPRESHIVRVDSENSEWIWPDQEIKKILVNQLKEVAEVQFVYAYFSGDEITIWTLLDSYDRDAREKVYKKELKICDILHIYNFDFRVTSINLVSPNELVRTGSRKIYGR